MTKYGTIKIPEEKYREHKQNKEELGMTWEEYIDGQSPEGLGDILHKLEQIESAQAHTVSKALELAESGSNVTEEDVQTVVETEIEKKVHERARDL